MQGLLVTEIPLERRSSRNSAFTAHSVSNQLLPRAGLDSWLVISVSTLISESPVAGAAVIEHVLNTGGKIAIAGEAESFQNIPQEALTLLQRYDAERLAYIRLHNGDLKPTFWLHDELGLFSRTETGELSHFAPLESNVRHEELLAKTSGIYRDDKLGCLRWMGGDLVPLLEDTMVITPKFLEKNSELGERGVTEQLQRIGMRKVIVLPAIDVDASPADFVVTQVNDTVFIPELDRQAFLARHPSPLLDIPDLLDEADSQLRQNGIVPVRLPMPVPYYSGHAAGIVSPVNLRQFRSADGALHAMVPWPEPTYRALRGSIVEPWPAQENHDQLKEVITVRLKQAGVESVTFFPVRSANGGGIQGLTAEVPSEFVEALRVRA